MLALTECHNPAGKPKLHGIKAAAVCNPVVDWTGFFGTPSDPVCPRSAEGIDKNQSITSPHNLDQQQLTVSGITAIRNELFMKPEAYFDPFASPLLFFRTPSSDLPIVSTRSSVNGSDIGLDADHSDQEPVRKRRSYRKYPPTGFDLLLPHMRVEVGRDCVLRDQAVELIDLMRRSSKRCENEAITLDNYTASRSLEIIERKGLGLWNANSVFEVGRWFGEILRKP